MARPYAKLRGLLAEKEITVEDLAAELDLSPASVSKRLMGKESWRVHEMWWIMRLLGVPQTKLHLIFPPDGRNEADVIRPDMKARRTA